MPAIYDFSGAMLSDEDNKHIGEDFSIGTQDSIAGRTREVFPARWRKSPWVLCQGFVVLQKTARRLTVSCVVYLCRYFKLLFAGAMSAVVSRTCVAPLERVKMDLLLKHGTGDAFTTAVQVRLGTTT